MPRNQDSFDDASADLAPGAAEEPAPAAGPVPTSPSSVAVQVSGPPGIRLPLETIYYGVAIRLCSILSPN